MKWDKELDASGLMCPLPILKAKKALADMPADSILKIICTDPGSVKDFQAFTRQTGHQLIEQVTTDSVFIHLVKHR